MIRDFFGEHGENTVTESDNLAFLSQLLIKLSKWISGAITAFMMFQYDSRYSSAEVGDGFEDFLGDDNVGLYLAPFSRI